VSESLTQSVPVKMVPPARKRGVGHFLLLAPSEQTGAKPMTTTRQQQRAAASATKKSPVPPELSPAANRARRAALKADPSRDQHDQQRAPQVRLLNRHAVCAIVGCSYPKLWILMREGAFPRSRIVGGRSMWISTEIDNWIAGLQIRPLKDDALEEAQ
jgi:predicted DNA-binding transcriptional regulator AlpA